MAFEARARGKSELPLDIVGTAFQWKVWKALTEIPAGETRKQMAGGGGVTNITFVLPGRNDIRTESQRQALTEMGCDEAQGYLISRPAPAEVCLALLTQA